MTDRTRVWVVIVFSVKFKIEPVPEISVPEEQENEIWLPLSKSPSSDIEKTISIKSTFGSQSSDDDPLDGLQLATDVLLHRSSAFLDNLTTITEEHKQKMENFYKFAKMRSQLVEISSGIIKVSDVKKRRTIMQSIHLLDQINLKHAVSIYDQYDQTVPCIFQTAQDHILEIIRASTVPKPKKHKKKKKRKHRTPTPTPDLMTPEEAMLDYQIVVAEEMLKEQLSILHTAEEENTSLEEHLVEVQKRYEQEIQACKSEFLENESELKRLEEEWSVKTSELERTITKIKKDIKETSRTIYAQITDVNDQSVKLEKEVAVWEYFKNGSMIKNATKIEELRIAMEAQIKNRKDHLELTEEQIELAEQSAKTAEIDALDDLCNQHINQVRNNLPQDEMQEIENRDTLQSELSALNKVYTFLLQHTDDIQKKTLFQAAAAQQLLESINADNAELVKYLLFTNGCDNMWKKLNSISNCNPNASPEHIFRRFNQLDEVKAYTTGLRIVGISISREPTSVPPEGTAALSPSPQSTTNLSPGFQLRMADANKMSTNPTISLLSNDCGTDFITKLKTQKVTRNLV